MGAQESDPRPSAPACSMGMGPYLPAVSQHRRKLLQTGNEVGTGLLLLKPHAVPKTGLQVTTPAARLVYTTFSFPTYLPRRNSEKTNIAEVKGSQELGGKT